MSRLLTDPETPRDPLAETQFELAGWIDTAPFEDLLSLHIEEAAGGRAVLSMPFLLKHCQGGGVMHGGALTSLADTAVAMAIKSLLPAESRFATTELSMRFVAPVRSGRVTAIASVSRPEERTFRGEASLYDSAGAVVAHCTCIFRLARQDRPG